MLYPCPHFDALKGKPLDTCPHETAKSEGEGCFHWMENYSPDDIFKPCREYTPEYRCDKTLDMFKEG